MPGHARTWQETGTAGLAGRSAPREQVGCPGCRYSQWHGGPHAAVRCRMVRVCLARGRGRCGPTLRSPAADNAPGKTDNNRQQGIHLLAERFHSFGGGEKRCWKLHAKQAKERRGQIFLTTREKQGASELPVYIQCGDLCLP